MQNRLAENVGADSCLFRRAKTRQGHAQANAKPAASVLFTGGIQGVYRGHTGGKAPAWEAIGRRKRVASHMVGTWSVGVPKDFLPASVVIQQGLREPQGSYTEPLQLFDSAALAVAQRESRFPMNPQPLAIRNSRVALRAGPKSVRARRVGLPVFDLAVLVKVDDAVVVLHERQRRVGGPLGFGAGAGA